MTRLCSAAARFCPAIVLPAVVKDMEITPETILTLLKMPASAEYVTSKRLIHAMRTILEKLIAADWIAIGMPSASSWRNAPPSMRKLARLKSKPKLSRRR